MLQLSGLHSPFWPYASMRNMPPNTTKRIEVISAQAVHPAAARLGLGLLPKIVVQTLIKAIVLNTNKIKS